MFLQKAAICVSSHNDQQQTGVNPKSAEWFVIMFWKLTNDKKIVLIVKNINLGIVLFKELNIYHIFLYFFVAFIWLENI